MWADIEGCGRQQLTSEAVGSRGRCSEAARTSCLPHVTLAPVTGAEEEGGAKGAGEKDGAATAQKR